MKLDIIKVKLIMMKYNKYVEIEIECFDKFLFGWFFIDWIVFIEMVISSVFLFVKSGKFNSDVWMY